MISHPRLTNKTSFKIGQMNETCSLLSVWNQEEIFSLPENISVNLTEDVSVSSSLCTALKLLSAANYLVQISGIICNVISFNVLLHLPKKFAFDYCLMFLTGFDTVFLLSSSTKLLLGEFIGLPSKTLAVFMVPLCISLTASLWVTVAVSVERSIAVNFVLQAKSICTYKRTIFVNMFILCFSVVVNIPLFVVLENISWDEDLMVSYIYLCNKYGKSISSHIPSWFFTNRKFFEICYLYVNSALMYGLALLTIAIFGTSTYIAMRKADRIHREMTQNQNVKRYKYRVFKGLVTVFCVTYFAVLSLEISNYNSLNLGFARLTESLCRLLISANSSSKIIIYVSLWKNFRDTLRSLRQKRCNQNVSTSHSSNAV